LLPEAGKSKSLVLASGESLRLYCNMAEGTDEEQSKLLTEFYLPLFIKPQDPSWGLHPHDII
jgi:hypothetical protein